MATKKAKKSVVKKKPNIVKTKPFKKSLPVKLTKQELYDLGRDLARGSAELKELDLKKKDVMADFASDKKRLESEESIVSRKITNEEEYRDINCQWVMNFKTGKKSLVRLDSNTSLRVSDITDEDRQEKFELE